eukprot:Phypoly_transcript_18584.p1 GENE.Phypoly_transcript_18584~~Phypoly_transcript_18584.p1  ORF type:complete len:213 (+),score=56.57 Phypoly_transcript_18584:79-639(+)
MASPDAQNRWTQIFNMLDANGSGTIEKADAAAAIQLLAKSGYFTATELAAFLTAATQILEGFIQAGENTNGKMILVQFLATAQAYVIGKSFETVPQWLRNATNQVFDILDRDRDGIISEDEIVTLVTGISSVSASVARAAYELLDGPLDKDAAQQEIWAWLSSPVTVAEDAYLPIAVAEVEAQKAL